MRTCNTCQTRCNRDTRSTYRGQQMYTLCIHISMSMHTLYTYRERVHLLRCIRGNVLQCECAQSVYRGQQMYTLHTHRVCTSVASVAPYIQKAHILYTEVRMLHIGSYVWGATHGHTLYIQRGSFCIQRYTFYI